MDISVNVLIALVVVAALVLLGWYVWQRQQTTALRTRYADEYDRTVAELGRRRGEAELRQRSRRVNKFLIRPLSQPERQRFAEQWHLVQEQFVDDPGGAVVRGDRLVNEVMRVRGYPMGDADRRIEDLSVDHAHVVSSYRTARGIAVKHSVGGASTEELRQAMVLYRELFDDLLNESTDETADRPVMRAIERDVDLHTRRTSQVRRNTPEARQ
jgi:hypothetical protein